MNRPMTTRPSREWYRRRIMEGLDHDWLIGPLSGADATVSVAQEDKQLGLAFAAFVQLERRARSLTVRDFAQRVDVDPDEIERIERDPSYRARPRTVDRLAEFTRLPLRSLMKLAGAAEDPMMQAKARDLRYAARSGNMSQLSADERAILREFVRFLKTSV